MDIIEFQIQNVKSVSKAKYMKPTPGRRAKKATEKTDPNSKIVFACHDIRHGFGNKSVELLHTPSAGHQPLQRWKTMNAFLNRCRSVDLAGTGDVTTLVALGKDTLQPGPVLSARRSSCTGRNRQCKLRYSIDNADVSGYKSLPKSLLETMQEFSKDGQANRIRVYVRVRPMSTKEKDIGAQCCVRAANNREIFLSEMAVDTDYLRLKRLKGRYFVFDGAFAQDVDQEEVYLASTAQLVEGVLEGRNSSVFCYGATGAGKTFTMLGTIENPGVMVLALKDLFLKLKQRSRDDQHSVRLSYLEVYNETVRDLLSPGKALAIREDTKHEIVATGLTQYQASSADEVMALLEQGNRNRTTEPTRQNETSSRSHAILQVIVEHSSLVESYLVTRTGKLSLVDLAGSERALATDQRTLRSLEGANINRSLLALSSCISALVEGKKHIPFRNSKLTQLLKDSLGGSCQTAMIANISPSNLSFGETQNTLYWADRAKEIRTKECVANEERTPGSEADHLQLLLEVQEENQKLRLQVAELQQKLLAIESSTSCASFGHHALFPAPSLEQQIQKESSSTPRKAFFPAPPLQQQIQKVNIQAPPLIQEIQKENIQTSAGTCHTAQATFVSGCVDKQDIGLVVACSNMPNQVASSRLSLDHAVREHQKQAISEETLMRTPLGLSSMNRKVLNPMLPPLDPSLGFHPTSRKRTYWDITNTTNLTGSPYAKSMRRNIRSNIAAETPSMLLQVSLLLFSCHASPFKRLVSCFDYFLQKWFTGD